MTLKPVSDSQGQSAIKVEDFSSFLSVLREIDQQWQDLEARIELDDPRRTADYRNIEQTEDAIRSYKAKTEVLLDETSYTTYLNLARYLGADVLGIMTRTTEDAQTHVLTSTVKIPNKDREMIETHVLTRMNDLHFLFASKNGETKANEYEPKEEAVELSTGTTLHNYFIPIVFKEGVMTRIEGLGYLGRVGEAFTPLEQEVIETVNASFDNREVGLRKSVSTVIREMEEKLSRTRLAASQQIGRETKMLVQERSRTAKSFVNGDDAYNYLLQKDVAKEFFKANVLKFFKAYRGGSAEEEAKRIPMRLFGVPYDFTPEALETFNRTTGKIGEHLMWLYDRMKNTEEGPGFKGATLNPSSGRSIDLRNPGNDAEAKNIRQYIERAFPIIQQCCNAMNYSVGLDVQTLRRIKTNGVIFQFKDLTNSIYNSLSLEAGVQSDGKTQVFNGNEVHSKVLRCANDGTGQSALGEQFSEFITLTADTLEYISLMSFYHTMQQHNGAPETQQKLRDLLRQNVARPNQYAIPKLFFGATIERGGKLYTNEYYLPFKEYVPTKA